MTDHCGSRPPNLLQVINDHAIVHLKDRSFSPLGPSTLGLISCFLIVCFYSHQSILIINLNCVFITFYICKDFNDLVVENIV